MRGVRLREMDLLLALSLIFISAACGRSQSVEKAVDPKIAASLEAFANRRIYKRLDKAVLAAVPDANLEQAVVDYVTTKLAWMTTLGRRANNSVSPTRR